MTLGYDLLSRLAHLMPRHPKGSLHLLDDAGSMCIDGLEFVIKVDGYALSRSLYPWCTPRDWGFRAISTAVSDVIAKGCEPMVYAVSIGLPSNWDGKELEDIVHGIVEAVKFYGGYIENVDTNYGVDGWIDVFVIGECRIKPIPRGGSLGDVLVITKPLGLGGACYLAYSRKVKLPRDAAAWGCRPTINPRITNALERVRHAIDGSIDVSDTFYESIEALLSPHNLEAFITVDPREMLEPSYLDLCIELGIDPYTCGLSTCEDYALLLSVKPQYLEDVLEELRKVGERPIVIGYVVSKGLGSWKGKEMKAPRWDHRSKSITI